MLGADDVGFHHDFCMKQLPGKSEVVIEGLDAKLGRWYRSLTVNIISFKK